MEALLKYYKYYKHYHNISTVETLHFITDIHNDSPWEGEMQNMDFW